ncbi:MAG TPA: aldo/keto reductase [Egibacteraceae bacterium]|nr:aldo/keto reductase [Egibacteraceae bacterium]
MRYRNLGQTGTLVSTLCLGTMNFGKESDEPTAHGQLDRFVESGGNFIDTADVYQRGTSEEFIGRWLSKRGRHDDLVIATKARMPMGEGPNEAGLSKPRLMRTVDASLRRLQVEAIDLYQAHCWDPRTPVEETLETFDDLVRAGKVRYVGVSNFAGWQLQRAALLARHNGWARVATLQPQYNLLAREIEWELVPVCLLEGIGILPWSPLGGGWLTGKYRPDQRPTGATRLGEDPGRGVEAYDKRNIDRTWRVLDAVREIAADRGATPAQIALAWVTDRPGVSSTILGARTVEQLDDNLGAADLELSEAERQRLDDASDPGLPAYPYGFIADLGAR